MARQLTPAVRALIRRRWRPANPGACRDRMAEALAALTDPTPGPTGDQALALLEQQRRNTTAGRQGQLPLEIR